MELSEIIERAQSALDKATRRLVITLLSSYLNDDIKYILISDPKLFSPFPDGVSKDIPALIVNSDSLFDPSDELSLDSFVSDVLERVLIPYGIVRSSDG